MMRRPADPTHWGPEPALRGSSWTVTLLLLLYLPSCVGWRSESATPAAVVGKHGPSEVRIRLTNGSRITLEGPRVHGIRCMAVGKGDRRSNGSACP